jgi:hypothetical protein
VLAIDLLSFFELKLNKLVPSENSVHSAIKGCAGECRRLFSSTLTKQAAAINASVQTYGIDLSILRLSKECSKQVRDVFKVYSSLMSPISTAVTQNVDPSDDGSVIASSAPNVYYIENVLGAIIQPMLQALRLCSDQSMQGTDAAVFMLNNVYSILV